MRFFLFSEKIYKFEQNYSITNLTNKNQNLNLY